MKYSRQRILTERKFVSLKVGGFESLRVREFEGLKVRGFEQHQTTSNNFEQPPLRFCGKK